MEKTYSGSTDSPEKQAQIPDQLDETDRLVSILIELVDTIYVRLGNGLSQETEKATVEAKKEPAQHICPIASRIRGNNYSLDEQNKRLQTLFSLIEI